MTNAGPEGVAVTQRRLWQEKLARCGDSPQAVGSESLEHKRLRYRLISQIFDGESDFSILDVGAGVGDYYGYLQAEQADRRISYRGVDITPEFCALARTRYPGIEIGNENILIEDVGRFDYVILSGIFHQRGETPIAEWSSFMHAMLSRAFSIAMRGIAFNVLSGFAEFKREENFYVDLLELQQTVVRDWSRFYRVCCDGPLFEATIFVYKSDAILARFPQPVFRRYVVKEDL